MNRGFFSDAETPDLFWRLLHYFNMYRIALSGLFVAVVFAFGEKFLVGPFNQPLFLFTGALYFLIGLSFIVPISLRKPEFSWQLSIQVCLDIVFVMLLIHASGGIQSGLGLLLLVSLAASGLIKSGRLTLFFSSLASIAILMEHSYDILNMESYSAQYVQAGLLSVGYFLMAGLMRSLAQYSRASEKLARERGVDLENMAQINQMVIEEMQDGILVVDAEARVLSLNRKALSLLCIEDEAGSPLSEYSTALFDRWLFWSKNHGAEMDLLFSACDGRKIRARFVAIAESNMAVVFLEDMSRVQEQARQLKLAALGRLTANIAHEIRNPLSAISYASELLLEDGEKKGRLIEIIRDNTRRLDGMVQDVLQLNRRDLANVERIDLAGFLDGFLDQFCEIWKVPRESFVLSVAEHMEISFDRSHLNQILWNLCRNAWRHCSKKEKCILLMAGAGRTQDTVNIDIIDDGPGIPVSLRGNLFEPFFTTAEEGTGLGLYIAREIAQANHAMIDYIEDNAGTHFRVACRSSNVE